MIHKSKILNYKLTCLLAANLILLIILLFNPVNSFALETYQFMDQWPSNSPMHLAVDSLRNVYVTSFYSNTIQKLDSSGVLLKQWGSSGSDNGQLLSPEGIAVDSSNNIYVVDSGNDRVQKFDSNGIFLTKWETGDIYERPLGIAVDLAGIVYVSDSSYVKKFDSNGKLLTKLQGFGYPGSIAVDLLGNLYVADNYNNNVQKFDSNGTLLSKWGSFGTGDGQFYSPSGITVDLLGNVYVTQSVLSSMQKFNSDGTVLLAKIGRPGSWGDGWFTELRGIAVDSLGNVYLANKGGNVIAKFKLVADNPPPSTSPLPSQLLPPSNAGSQKVALNVTLFLSAKPRVIKANKVVVINGQIIDSKGQPVVNKEVVIKNKVLKAINKKIKGKIKSIKKWIWKKLAIIKTDKNGKFVFKHKPKQTTIYKAEYAGDNDYKATSSGLVKVVVKKAKKKRSN